MKSVKKYLAILMLAVLMLPVMPVGAAEKQITKAEMRVAVPVAGEAPAAEADVSYWVGETEIEIDGVPIEWKVQTDDGSRDVLTTGAVFENERRYYFEATTAGGEMILKKLNDAGVDISVADPNAELYVNGILVGNGKYTNEPSFYIGGIETANWEVDWPTAGEAFPTSGKMVLSIGGVREEYELRSLGWKEFVGLDAGEPLIEVGAVAEAGKSYMPEFSSGEDVALHNALVEKADLRTKWLFDGALMGPYMTIVAKEVGVPETFDGVQRTIVASGVSLVVLFGAGVAFAKTRRNYSQK